MTVIWIPTYWGQILFGKFVFSSWLLTFRAAIHQCKSYSIPVFSLTLFLFKAVKWKYCDSLASEAHCSVIWYYIRSCWIPCHKFLIMSSWWIPSLNFRWKKRNWRTRDSIGSKSLTKKITTTTTTVTVKIRIKYSQSSM